jgi:hypothetical protein
MPELQNALSIRLVKENYKFGKQKGKHLRLPFLLSFRANFNLSKYKRRKLTGMKWIKEINQKQEISLLSLSSLLIRCLSIY